MPLDLGLICKLPCALHVVCSLLQGDDWDSMSEFPDECNGWLFFALICDFEYPGRTDCMRLCARSLYRAPAFAALPPFSRMHVLDLWGGCSGWALLVGCPVSQRSILFWMPQNRICEAL